MEAGVWLPHAFLDALADDYRDRGGRGHDHSQVHELRDIRDPLICLDAQHAGALVADRVDGPAERTAHQAPQHGPTDAALSFRRADHGYATGSGNGVQGCRSLRSTSCARS